MTARFDERSNLHLAAALEKAGVHVVYGVLGLKTHCKTALVVRQEPDGSYVQRVSPADAPPGPATQQTLMDLTRRRAEQAAAGAPESPAPLEPPHRA